MVDVCAIDGVPVGKSRSGLLVHLDELPENAEPHDAVPVTREQWASGQSPRAVLRQAAQDMLVHHVGGHPEADCQFAQNLREAIRLA